MAVNIGGPHRGHAAGNTDAEKQASQLASDVKLKVKEKLGPHTDMNPAQVAQAYERQLESSPAPGPVKALARKKLKVGVSEQYGISELARKSTVNALLKVFVEGVDSEETEDISEADEKQFWIVVTDKKTGNTYRRKATREKMSELRSNPNIRKVEMTNYHPKETDDRKGQKTAKVKAGKGLDPVGKEDSRGDVDNDNIPASRDKNDKYLLKRRAAIGNAIKKRGTVSASYKPEGEMLDEKKKSKVKPKVKRWWDDDGDGIGWEKGEVKKEEYIGEAKKAKKKNSSDAITGEGVNNSKYINLKPTMEEINTQPLASTAPKTSSVDPNKKKQIQMRQQQVQMALNRQRQTMQLQRSGRLALNYSEDNTPEGDDIQEVAPPGMEKTVKRMKKHPKLSTGETKEGKKKNIYALAWYMYNKKKKGVEEEADCGCDDEPKLKKSEGGVDDYREVKTKTNLIKNKFRAMGLKMSYEPEGEVIGEEESDRVRDRQLERGGMGARSSSSPARQTSTKPQTDAEKKASAEKHKTALDLVRQSIIARHGKGSLM